MTNSILKDLNVLTRRKIVYQSINLNPKVDKEGNFLYKQDYPDRLVKVPTNMPNTYTDIKLTRLYNKHYNSSIVPTGWRYNLIGIDIDNKDDTIVKYNETKIDIEQHFNSNKTTDSQNNDN